MNAGATKGRSTVPQRDAGKSPWHDEQTRRSPRMAIFEEQ